LKKKMIERKLKLIEHRFEQCLSALKDHMAVLDSKLKSGTLMILMKYIGHNILRPLSGSDSLPDFIFLPNLEDYKYENYDNIAEGYAEWEPIYGIHEASFFEMEEDILLPIIEDVKGKTIMDVGCGNGRYSLIFAKAGANVTGVDLTPEMIASAQQKASTDGLEIDFICDDILGVNLAPNRFDLIFSSLAITHIEDLTELLRKLKPALKSDGRIIFSDIHPCFKMMGANVGFIRDDRFIEIRHYIHRVSDYFTAASNCGLQVKNMIEFPDKSVIPLFMVVALE